MCYESATQLLYIDGNSPSHTALQIHPVARILFYGNDILNERNFPIYHGENRIGRDRSSHIFIPSLHLSRIHAIIYFQSGFSFLSDCNSHNGTFRSTLRLTPHFRYELIDGTKFKLGDLAFIFYTDPLYLNLVDQLDQPPHTPISLLSTSPLSKSCDVPIKFKGDIMSTTTRSLRNNEKSHVNSYLITIEKFINCYETTQKFSVYNDFDVESQLCHLASKTLVHNAISLSKSELSFTKSFENIYHDQHNINPLDIISSSCMTSEHYPSNFDDNTFLDAIVDIDDEQLIDASLSRCLDTVRNVNHDALLSLTFESNLTADHSHLKSDDLTISNSFFKIDANKIPVNFTHDYISRMVTVFPMNFDSYEVSPVIIFTYILEEKYRRIVAKLGGRITTDVFQATHLITDKIRRTIKFLCCLGRGCEILCSDWLIKSKVSGKFLDTKPFRIQDKANECKYNFILEDSCEKARTSQMFSGYLFFLTNNIVPMPEEMRKIIDSSGGRMINSLKNHSFPFLLITCEKDLQVVFTTLGNPPPKTIKLLSTEFVLTGILRQSVDFCNFSFLGADNTKTICSNDYPKRRKRC